MTDRGMRTSHFVMHELITNDQLINRQLQSDEEMLVVRLTPPFDLAAFCQDFAEKVSDRH